MLTLSNSMVDSKVITYKEKNHSKVYRKSSRHNTEMMVYFRSSKNNNINKVGKHTMTISTINSRNAMAIQAINNENVLELMQAIVCPSRSYGATMQSSDYDLAKYKGDAVDNENLVISVMLWAENILEVDDFAKESTLKLLAWQENSNTHFWDYNVLEFLEGTATPIEEFEHIMSNYTYNDSDYCRLDRDIHYTTFKYDGEYYVCFSVHHGADARVGFSDSVILKIKDYCYFISSMEVTIYNTVTDDDIDWWTLEDVAYFKEGDWYMKDTNELISVYSSANGF